MVIGPCDAKSRWHRFAFSIADEGKVLKISQSTSSKKLVLSIDGLVRTEVMLSARAYVYVSIGSVFVVSILSRHCLG